MTLILQRKLSQKFQNVRFRIFRKPPKTFFGVVIMAHKTCSINCMSQELVPYVKCLLFHKVRHFLTVSVEQWRHESSYYDYECSTEETFLQYFLEILLWKERFSVFCVCLQIKKCCFARASQLIFKKRVVIMIENKKHKASIVPI